MATKAKHRDPLTIKTAAPLLTRTAVFLVLCVIFSGLIGSRIVGHGLIDHDGFQVYGSLGKALLFGAVALGLFIRRRGKAVPLKAWHWSNAVWLVLAVAAVSGAWMGVSKLIGGTHGAGWPVLVHVCLLGSLGLAALGSFGLGNLRRLGNTYRREILTALGLSAVFYVFLYAVYGLWSVLAGIVLHLVNWLLNLVGVTTTVLPGHSLLLSKFAITINEYCSGIESIALFTALYALVGMLDWERFNHHCYFWIFPLGLLALLGFNVLRVFGLILAGYYINPTIAFSLFHTYAGMVFFILYSGLFWAVSYRWMLAD